MTQPDGAPRRGGVPLAPRSLRRLGVEPASRNLYDALEQVAALDHGVRLVWTDPSVLARVAGADEAIEAAFGSGTPALVLPRLSAPLPDDGKRPDGRDLAELGWLHPGFLAVRGSEAVASAARTAAAGLEGATARAARSLEVFAALAPAQPLAGDPFALVGAWSTACGTDDGDEPRSPLDMTRVGFVDLEGIDPDQPWVLDGRFADAPRVTRRSSVELAGLLDAAMVGWVPPAGDEILAGGLRIDGVIRSLVRDAIARWRAGDGELPPDPTMPGGHRAFVAWLNAPDPASFGSASRYFWSLYLTRPDLQTAFALPSAAGARAFGEWAANVWFPEHRSLLLAQDIVAPPVPAPVAAPVGGGVNVIGYLDAEFSLGHIARQLRATVEASGLRTAGFTYGRTNSPRLADPPSDDPTLPFSTSIAVVNADQFGFLVADLGRPALASRYTIGYWFWELDVIPPHMRSAIAHVDEIWTGSTFIRDAFRAVTVKPVHSLPPLLELPLASDRDRASFGLEPDQFVFVCTFDFFSVAERKNPLGVIEAFRRAFGDRDDVQLVVKSTNGGRRPSQLERLRACSDGLANIRLVDAHFSRPDQMALLREADAVVSLHRSEGLGLHLAEAMALGTPVVATRYSGNLDFMDDANSFLVDAGLVPIEHGEGVYPGSARWADPDLDQAAAIMRSMVDDRAASASKIAAALRTAAELAGAAAIERVRARLDHLGIRTTNSWNGEVRA